MRDPHLIRDPHLTNAFPTPAESGNMWFRSAGWRRRGEIAMGFAWRLAGLAFLAGLVPAEADHRPIPQEDLDYPGTIAVADGHGAVDVRIHYLAQEDCWRINSAREGLPNAATDEPTERHLYITVAVEKTAETCQQRLNGLTTRLQIPDKPGRISVDILFVDQRGVYQRSQRHRILR